MVSLRSALCCFSSSLLSECVHVGPRLYPAAFASLSRRQRHGPGGRYTPRERNACHQLVSESESESTYVVWLSNAGSAWKCQLCELHSHCSPSCSRISRQLTAVSAQSAGPKVRFVPNSALCVKVRSRRAQPAAATRDASHSDLMAPC